MKKIYQETYDKGFLPGPIETEKEFFERIDATERVLLHPKKYITEKSYAKATLSPLGGAALLANTKNRFYHAASTTIVELKNGLILPIISVPSSRLVKKEEVIKHELVHARRVLFEEPKFEEILAFRTSKSKLRAIASPMFSTKTDIYIFMTGVICSSFSIALPVICWAFLCSREIPRRSAFIKCITYLKMHTTSCEEILAAMTDNEIISMSKGKLEEIDFTLFRWKFLETIFGKIK
jgi:hypothetical protein